MKFLIRVICLISFYSVSTLFYSASAGAAVYLQKNDFLAESFDLVPETETLWLNGKLKEELNTLLSHPYKGLRVRYWRQNHKTAWILNEIGKVKPITIGVVIDNQKVMRVAILAFRESRGWEIKYPFFTDQFSGLWLESEGALNQSIDGISGATLSVRAVTRITRLALYLHNRVVSNQVVSNRGQPR